MVETNPVIWYFCTQVERKGGIAVDSRLVFNDIADEYDKWRPTYAPELFADIMAYSGINQSSNVLEVGIGTGKAT